MRSRLYEFSGDASTLQRHFQRFLVPPFQRFQFVLLFVLTTGAGWVLVELVLRFPSTVVLPPLGQDGLLAAFVNGLVVGLIIGASQWLVLRPYIPDWLWIVATTTGYVISTTTLQAWVSILAQILNPFLSGAGVHLPAPALFAISQASEILLATVCTIWLGLAQWLLLRQYSRPSWSWVFVPSLAILLSSTMLSLLNLPGFAQIHTWLNLAVLTIGILGITQAIAFCTLYQRRDGSASESASALHTAPEISNYGQVQKLRKRLHQRLQQHWQSEISSDRPLTYQVGITGGGAIAACEPETQLAAEFVQQTPLYAVEESASDLSNFPAQSLARFQVTFRPSGSLEICSWRGIPLWWIGVSMVVLLLGVSLGAVYLR
jgi:hypothetical protein